MTSSSIAAFNTRRTVTVELPVRGPARVVFPDQVILKLGDSHIDIGSFCYSQRAKERRRHRKPANVVLESFLRNRRQQVTKLIDALSAKLVDGGNRPATVLTYAGRLKEFVDWADDNNHRDCLNGGEATRHAFMHWADHIHECYRRQEISADTRNQNLRFVCEILQSSIGPDDLNRGLRIVPKDQRIPTAPLPHRDFVHAAALNQALFDGFCDLVLGNQPFPYKLAVPATLSWPDDHLWVFPTKLFCLPPFRLLNRDNLRIGSWAYDYENGCVASPDTITNRYSGRIHSQRRKTAKTKIREARRTIAEANSNSQSVYRRLLANRAHDAFLFLFFCNTSANEAVAREIETDGTIHASTINQRFRSIKFRAGGKAISLETPAAFMPSLRRFMDLRRYLLGSSAYPFLFFNLGVNRAQPPRQLGMSPLTSYYSTLRSFFDPSLPKLGSRKLRATVADYYQRNHDAAVTAKVLQNTERTAQQHYDDGSASDHHEELSLFLSSVSASAKEQRIVSNNSEPLSRILEEGGGCNTFGSPDPLTEDAPVKPNCKDTQGCMFCSQRVLIAGENDARKVASAAFVMEQLITGPKHEEAFRPLIDKCDDDLKKMAAFPGCREMVERVRKDVYEHGNLTPYFADKFHFLLELGFIA